MLEKGNTGEQCQQKKIIQLPDHYKLATQPAEAAATVFATREGPEEANGNNL